MHSACKLAGPLLPAYIAVPGVARPKASSLTVGLATSSTLRTRLCVDLEAQPTVNPVDCGGFGSSKLLAPP